MFTEQRNICFDESFAKYGIHKNSSQGGFCCCGSVVRDNYKELLAEQIHPLEYSCADFKLPVSEKVNASSLPGHSPAFDIGRTNSYDEQGHHQLSNCPIVSSQAGFSADGAGESALSAEEAPSAGSANSENFTRK